jgi:hypothetical protein
MFFSLYSVQMIIVGAFVLNHPVYNIININNERDTLYGHGILLRYLLEKTILLIVNLGIFFIFKRNILPTLI